METLPPLIEELQAQSQGAGYGPGSSQAARSATSARVSRVGGAGAQGVLKTVPSLWQLTGLGSCGAAFCLQLAWPCSVPVAKEELQAQ